MGLGRKFAAYRKAGGTSYALAALSNRLTGRPRLFRAKAPVIAHPVFIRVRTSDMAVFREVLIDRIYDFSISEPQTILDLGANCGLASVFYANKYPSARIMAVEPEHGNFVALKRNCGPYERILAIEGAVWSSDGTVSLGHMSGEDPEFSQWDYQVRSSGELTAQAFTIETLARMAGVDSFDLIKCDIEGGEVELLSHTPWIRNVKTLVVELHDRFIPGCREALEKGCAGGFDFHDKGEVILCTNKALA